MLLALLTIQPVQANALPGPAIPAILNQEIPALNNVPIPARAKVIKLLSPADKPVQQQQFADRLVIMTVSPAVLIPAQAKGIKLLSPVDTLVQRPAFADKPVTKTASVLQPVKTRLPPSRLTRLTQRNPARLAVLPKPSIPAGLVTTAMKNQEIPALNNVPIPAQAKVTKPLSPAGRLVRQRLFAVKPVIMIVKPLKMPVVKQPETATHNICPIMVII